MKNKLLCTLMVALISGSTLHGMEWLEKGKRYVQEYLKPAPAEEVPGKEKVAELEKKLSLEGIRAYAIIEKYAGLKRSLSGVSEEELEKRLKEEEINNAIDNDEQFKKQTNILNQLNKDLNILYLAFINKKVIGFQTIKNPKTGKIYGEKPRYVTIFDIQPLYLYKNVIESNINRYIEIKTIGTIDVDFLKKEILNIYKQLPKNLNVYVLKKADFSKLNTQRELFYAFFNKIDSLKKELANKPEDFNNFIYKIFDVESSEALDFAIYGLQNYLNALENRREKLLHQLQETGKLEREERFKKEKEQEEEILKKRPRKFLSREEYAALVKEQEERLKELEELKAASKIKRTRERLEKEAAEQGKEFGGI